MTAGARPWASSRPPIAKQLDRLQPIVSFGAQRNVILKTTPTFAEVTGNPKPAFTESVGVFASPKLDPAARRRLTNAFIAAGNDLDVVDRVEAENIPLAINRPGGAGRDDGAQRAGAGGILG